MAKTKCKCTSCDSDFYYKDNEQPDIKLSLRLDLVADNHLTYNIGKILETIHLCENCVTKLSSTDGSEDKVDIILKNTLTSVIKDVLGTIRTVHKSINKFDIMKVD